MLLNRPAYVVPLRHLAVEFAASCCFSLWLCSVGGRGDWISPSEHTLPFLGGFCTSLNVVTFSQLQTGVRRILSPLTGVLFPSPLLLPCGPTSQAHRSSCPSGDLQDVFLGFFLVKHRCLFERLVSWVTSCLLRSFHAAKQTLANIR